MENKKEINKFLAKYYLYAFFRGMLFIGSFIMIIVNNIIHNAFDITILVSMFYVIRVVFGIPSGAFADRYGRKNTLIIAHLLYILAFIFLAIRRGFPDLMIYYLLIGLAFTFESVAFEAFIYDNMKKLDIEKNYARYESKKNAIRRVMFSLSSFFASYLILFGYNVVIFSTIFTSYICGLLIILTIEDTNRYNKNITKLNDGYLKVLKKGFVFSFKHTTILKFIMLMILSVGFLHIVDHYFELFIFHITNNLSIVPILVGGSFGIAALFSISLTKHYESKNMIFVIGVLMFTIIFALIGFIFYSFIASSVLITLFLCGFFTFHQLANAKKQMLIPSKIRATVNSVEGFLLGIVGVIYLLLFGKIVEMLSYRAGFITMSVITLVIVIAFLFILGNDKHLRKKEAKK